MCKECYKKNHKHNIRPSYEQLTEEIINMGYSAVGRKYSVSDSAIRKWVLSYK